MNRPWRRRFVAGMVAVMAASMVTLMPGSTPFSTEQIAPVAEAPDAAAAVAAANRQGTPVEVLAKRTQSRAVFANPGGTMTAQLTPVPVRVRKGASWAKIDTTLERRADGRIAPKASDGDLTLSPGGKTAPLVTMNRDGKTLALSWPGELPAPVVATNEVTYPDVLPGADLVIFAERNGFRQHLIVKNADAAKNQALHQIRMKIESDGLTVKADDSGALSVTDANGKELFSAPPSSMWDSAGKSTVFKVSVVDRALVMEPDEKFLADPALKFPVTIDPVLTTAYKQAWANVLSGYAGTSYWNTSGDGSKAQVGQCPRDLPPSGSWCNGIGEGWAYFQYDTGWLWDKKLKGATLSTTVTSSSGCADRIHDLYHTDGQIWNGMTWNTKLNGAHIRER
ncbi:hypothetical protein [Kibdelosporangium philippinense]